MAFGALKNLFKEDVEDEEELYEPEDYDDVEEEPKPASVSVAVFSQKRTIQKIYIKKMCTNQRMTMLFQFVQREQSRWK